MALPSFPTQRNNSKYPIALAESARAIFFFKNLLTKIILRDMMYYVRRSIAWIFN